MLMTIFYVNLSRPAAVESPLLIQDRCIPVGQTRTSHILLDNLALSNSNYLHHSKMFHQISVFCTLRISKSSQSTIPNHQADRCQQFSMPYNGTLLKFIKQKQKSCAAVILKHGN